MGMSERERTDPFGDGETVYATDPEPDQTSEDREWPDYTDPEWLHFAYHIQGMTQKEMADEFDREEHVIKYHMNKHGVETRSKGERQSFSRGNRELFNEDWLRSKYNSGMSLKEIGDEIGVSDVAVWKAFDRFDIETSPQGVPSSRRSKAGKTERLYTNKDWLEKKYWDELKSTHDIAEQCGCSNSTIRRWMEQFDIPRRSRSEAMELENRCDETTFSSSGYEREFVARDENGNVVLNQSWQYFDERPAAESE